MNYASSITDEPIGAEVEITVGDEEMVGVVKEVEATVPKPTYPEIGESVTFKAVGGEVEKTVSNIVDGQQMPIRFREGGAAERRNLVEYSETERHKVIELPDGRELWAKQGSN